MKGLYRKILTAAILSLTLAFNTINTVFASSNYINESSFTDNITLSFDEGNSRSTVTNGTLFSYTLNNNEIQYQTTISAPSNSAAIYDLYTLPTGSEVTVYIRDGRWSSSNIYTHIFDVGGHSSKLSISIDKGQTYHVFIKASSATASNPTIGTVTYKKTTS